MALRSLHHSPLTTGIRIICAIPYRRGVHEVMRDLNVNQVSMFWEILIFNATVVKSHEKR